MRIKISLTTIIIMLFFFGSIYSQEKKEIKPVKVKKIEDTAVVKKAETPVESTQLPDTLKPVESMEKATIQVTSDTTKLETSQEATRTPAGQKGIPEGDKPPEEGTRTPAEKVKDAATDQPVEAERTPANLKKPVKSDEPSKEDVRTPVKEEKKKKDQ